MPFESLSWESPRNADEIGRVAQNAILKQWMIPSIDFGMPDGASYANKDKSIHKFILSGGIGTKKHYRITIETIPS